MSADSVRQKKPRSIPNAPTQLALGGKYMKPTIKDKNCKELMSLIEFTKNEIREWENFLEEVENRLYKLTLTKKGSK
mgnify:CR=1 FL=1